jgi:acyl-coenzyme A synthetase/AMP-(fatty) acid ligase
MMRDLVTSAERATRYRSEGLWDASTLPGRVLAWAADRPHAVAVVDRAGERRVTYAELADDAMRLAAHMGALGVHPGDVVSVQLPNWYETVVVGLAVLAADGVVNPLLPGYREREIRHVVGTARPRLIVTPDTYRNFAYRPMIESVMLQTGSSAHHIEVGDAGDGGLWHKVPQHGGLTALPERSAADVSELIFTSGTEAAPKGIMHSEETANFSVRVARQHLGLSDDDVVWMPSPIGHSTGFNYGVRFALYHGLKLVLQDQWDTAVATRLIEQERCTYTLAATTFLSDLVVRGESHDLSSMRYFGCGGAPVPAELVRAARARGISVLRLYGSTEVLVATWNLPTSSAAHQDDTDGVALPHLEVETRSDDGTVTVAGERGEIFVRGPNTCVGFFDDPERTQATFSPDGWVKSGDLAVMDDAGYLTVAGRKKEIIIRGGMNITPREIEEVLLEHPSIIAAAVVGLPDPRLGEIACACLVLEQGRDVDAESLIAWLRGTGMATYKLPERVEVVAALPYTASGKVKKHELVALLMEHER